MEQEQSLRHYREQALKLLQENQAQSREGVELLVKDRLTKLTLAASGGHALSDEQLQNLYLEVLDLSYNIFSLGFVMAHSAKQPAAR